MGNVKKIEAFETTNGLIFATEQEAKQQQAVVDFLEWYDDNKCYGNYAGSYVDASDMLDWITENGAIIKALLD